MVLHRILCRNTFEREGYVIHDETGDVFIRPRATLHDHDVDNSEKMDNDDTDKHEDDNGVASSSDDCPSIPRQHAAEWTRRRQDKQSPQAQLVPVNHRPQQKLSKVRGTKYFG